MTYADKRNTDERTSHSESKAGDSEGILMHFSSVCSERRRKRKSREDGELDKNQLRDRKLTDVRPSGIDKRSCKGSIQRHTGLTKKKEGLSFIYVLFGKAGIRRIEDSLSEGSGSGSRTRLRLGASSRPSSRGGQCRSPRYSCKHGVSLWAIVRSGTRKLGQRSV
jgi:hypothetical protein